MRFRKNDDPESEEETMASDEPAVVESSPTAPQPPEMIQLDETMEPGPKPGRKTSEFGIVVATMLLLWINQAMPESLPRLELTDNLLAVTSAGLALGYAALRSWVKRKPHKSLIVNNTIDERGQRHENRIEEKS
jgi:hypothetical protein